MNCRNFYWIALASGTILFPAQARDLFVNHETGEDGNSAMAGVSGGKEGPVKTVKQALRLSQPGDTIRLAKTATPYPEGIEMPDGKSGSPGKPLTIDGQGATLSGATPINAADWTKVSDGLYRNDHLLPDIFPRQKPVNAALLRRFFFLREGRIIRMGRSGKGDCPPLPKPADLKPGEWTYDEDDMAFYLKTEPSQSLSDEQIEYPALGNGVRTSDGHCEHLVIRNLTVTHFWNDGFNINGTANMRFENIQAIECGDDGLSAHATSRVEVDGFVSRGNSTGVCNVQGSNSSSRRLVLENNHGFEILLTGSGTHEIRDSVISPNRGVIRVVRVSSEGEGAGEGMGCTLVMENVWINGDLFGQSETGKARPEHEFNVEVFGKSALLARRVTLSSVGLASRWPAPGFSRISWFDSVIEGAYPPMIRLIPETTWEADQNTYDLTELTVGGLTYQQAQWKEYQKATGQDARSVWKAGGGEAGDQNPPSRGADLGKLPLVNPKGGS